MTFLIRTVALADRPQWQPLWEGYQSFYQVVLPESVTEATWARFLDPAEPVQCLVAEHDQTLVGLVHYLFHRNTWMLNQVCYLQDLFIGVSARGQGVGRKLIETVYEQARQKGAERVYWMTHETNTQAMELYDKVAKKSGFLQYRKELT